MDVGRSSRVMRRVVKVFAGLVGRVLCGMLGLQLVSCEYGRGEAESSPDLDHVTGCGVWRWWQQNDDDDDVDNPKPSKTQSRAGTQSISWQNE